MTDAATSPEDRRADGSSRSRRRRLPIPGVLVDLEAAATGEHTIGDVGGKRWVVDAIDLNAGGIGVVLPPELSEDTQVLLTFQLPGELAFSRLPATVSHREGTSGGVHFAPWPPAERLKLLEYLVTAYEREG